MGLDIYFQRSFYSKDRQEINGDSYDVKYVKTTNFNSWIYQDLIDFMSEKVSDYGIMNCMNYEFRHDLIPEIIDFCSEKLSECEDEDKDYWSDVMNHLKEEQVWFEQNYDTTEAIMVFSIWF